MYGCVSLCVSVCVHGKDETQGLDLLDRHVVIANDVDREQDPRDAA